MKVSDIIVVEAKGGLLGKLKADAVTKRVAKTAIDDFYRKLDFNQLDGADQTQLLQILKKYVFEYMVSGEHGAGRNAVALAIEKVPMPEQFNRTTVEAYIKQTAKARQQALDAVEHQLPKADEPEPVAEPAAEPEPDISQTLDSYTQYRFRHPEYPGIQIVIRQSGYYLDRLPKGLTGTVKKDKATGLYPVLRQDNIRKYNQYYDVAADMGRVIEEPIAAL